MGKFLIMFLSNYIYLITFCVSQSPKTYACNCFHIEYPRVTSSQLSNCLPLILHVPHNFMPCPNASARLCCFHMFFDNALFMTHFKRFLSFNTNWFLSELAKKENFKNLANNSNCWQIPVTGSPHPTLLSFCFIYNFENHYKQNNFLSCSDRNSCYYHQFVSHFTQKRAIEWKKNHTQSSYLLYSKRPINTPM
jgi:hypothetical protein